MKTVNAKFNSKSNFKNLNGQFLKVVQFLGTIVFVEYYDAEMDAIKTCDFYVNELVEIREFEENN